MQTLYIGNVMLCKVGLKLPHNTCMPQRSDTSTALNARQTPTWRESIALAMVLALGAAVSLGVTRFSYGLLLPAMRADLGWSYTLAGAMNTVNALGYLLGALSMPKLLKRFDAVQILLIGSALASVFMAMTGFFTTAEPLLVQRLLAGIASAWVFVAGGLLAAQLGAHHTGRGGLILGVYYGGVGLGIVFSSWLVPVVEYFAHAESHAWHNWAWWILALGCALATLVLLLKSTAFHRVVQASTAKQKAVFTGQPSQQSQQFEWAKFSYALAGYGLFGVGYIGYMTFRDCAVARAGRDDKHRHHLLHSAGSRRYRVIAHLGGFAGSVQRWASVGLAQWIARLRDCDSGRDHLVACLDFVGCTCSAACFCLSLRQPRHWYDTT